MFASSAIVGSMMPFDVLQFRLPRSRSVARTRDGTRAGIRREHQKVPGHGLGVKLVNLTSLQDGQSVQDIGRLEVQFFL